MPGPTLVTGISVSPAAAHGVRITSGTRTHAAYGQRLPTHRCSPDENPYRSRQTMSVSSISPSRAPPRRATPPPGRHPARSRACAGVPARDRRPWLRGTSPATGFTQSGAPTTWFIARSSGIAIGTSSNDPTSWAAGVQGWWGALQADPQEPSRPGARPAQERRGFPGQHSGRVRVLARAGDERHALVDEGKALVRRRDIAVVARRGTSSAPPARTPRGPMGSR